MAVFGQDTQNQRAHPLDLVLVAQHLHDAKGKDVAAHLFEHEVGVGHGQADANCLAFDLDQEHQVGIHDLFELFGDGGDLAVGNRHLAPVRLPSAAVDDLDFLDIVIEVLHIDLADRQAAALFEFLDDAVELWRKPVHRAAELLDQIEFVGVEIHRAFEAIGGEQFRIIGRVVGHHDTRHVVEAVNQQAHLIADRKGYRAAHDGAALVRPARRRQRQTEHWRPRGC